MNKKSIFFVILVSVIICACAQDPKLNLIKSAFFDLIEGKKSAIEKIDWESFVTFGIDVGIEYRLLPDEQEKEKYREELVKNVAVSFQKIGGQPKHFSNWRTINVTDTEIIVATDYKYGNVKKTMFITATKESSPKLTLLFWQQPKQ